MDLVLLFDLDGTLTDSREGIVKSVRYALEKLSLPIPPEETLLRFIGPPLEDSFQRCCGLTEAGAAEAGKAADKFPQSPARTAGAEKARDPFFLKLCRIRTEGFISAPRASGNTWRDTAGWTRRRMSARPIR